MSSSSIDKKLFFKSLRIRIITFSLPVLIACQEIDFDAEQWKNWSETESQLYLRWAMSDAILKHQRAYLGKDTTAIMRLFGSEKVSCHRNTCTISYPLGPCQKGINYGNLSFVFQDNQLKRIDRRCN